MSHDVLHFYKLKNFLCTYSPFKFAAVTPLISLSSGLVAGVDDSVNCDQAEETGKTLQRKWDKMAFEGVTPKKAERVKTMANVSNSCSVESQRVNIDPNTVFHRLIAAGERFGSLRSCFAYKLTADTISHVAFQGRTDA